MFMSYRGYFTLAALAGAMFIESTRPLFAAAARVTAAITVSDSHVGTATYIEGSRRALQRTNFLSAQLVRPIVHAGRATTAPATTLTDTNSFWANDRFNGTNGPFYVEFDSGLMVDIADTVAASQSLALVGDATGMTTNGCAYRIRRHLTLANMFGRTNHVGLLGGTNSAEADNVLVHVPETQETQIFFYCNEPGSEGWLREDRLPAADMVIFPEQGIIIRRRGVGRIVLSQHGAVKRGFTMAPMAEGTNLVGTLKVRKNLRLSELNLHTGNDATGIIAGESPETADNLVIVNPVNGSSKTYFYCDLPGKEGWCDVNLRAAGRVLIKPGSAFYVMRKSSHGSFYWTIPAE
jgi:hypothetical protein